MANIFYPSGLVRLIPYCNIDNGIGRYEYRDRVKANLDTYQKLFQKKPEQLANFFDFPKNDNHALLEKISEFGNVPLATVKGMNLSDETLNFGTDGWYGCTSIGRDGIIGQNLDLFALDLAVVRDQEAIYVTMPPYLTLMGMSRHLAFCTNHLFSPVRDGDTPISFIRRDLLRLKTLAEAIAYLRSIKPMTSVNFLMSDGTDTVDLEVTPAEVKVWPAKDGICAHTNHLVDPNFFEDTQCTRLTRAVELLKEKASFESILDDDEIFVPVTSVREEVAFGTIIQVIMDVKAQTMKYRGTHMGNYVSVGMK